MTEEQPPIPEDPYGISKYAVELDLQAAHRLFGLDFVIFRPHNVYGVRQNLSDRYRNVLGIFMNQTLRGQPMTIFGDGRQTRAFSHIADVAPYIAESPEIPQARNQVFNVGADHPATVLRIAELVAANFEVELQIKFLPPREEVLHAFSSHEKMRHVFKGEIWRRESKRWNNPEMVRWARSATGSLGEQSVFGAIEINKNLPPSWRPA